MKTNTKRRSMPSVKETKEEAGRAIEHAGERLSQPAAALAEKTGVRRSRRRRIARVRRQLSARRKVLAAVAVPMVALAVLVVRRRRSRRWENDAD